MLAVSSGLRSQGMPRASQRSANVTDDGILGTVMCTGVPCSCMPFANAKHLQRIATVAEVGT